MSELNFRGTLRFSHPVVKPWYHVRGRSKSQPHKSLYSTHTRVTDHQNLICRLQEGCREARSGASSRLRPCAGCMRAALAVHQLQLLLRLLLLLGLRLKRLLPQLLPARRSMSPSQSLSDSIHDASDSLCVQSMHPASHTHVAACIYGLSG